MRAFGREWLTSGAKLLLPLLLGLVGGFVGSRLAEPPPAVAQTTIGDLTARRFVLVDARGNVRAELGPIQDSVAIANPAVGLTITSGSGAITGGPGNRIALQMRVDNDGRGVIVACTPDEGCTGWPPRPAAAAPTPSAGDQP